MCAPVGNTKQLSNTFNELRFSLLLPADLPKGRYEVPIKYIRGIQHHYYNGWREHYKMPYSQVKQLPATNTLMLSFNNTGSCRPSAQSLEIFLLIVPMVIMQAKLLPFIVTSRLLLKSHYSAIHNQHIIIRGLRLVWAMAGIQ